MKKLTLTIGMVVAMAGAAFAQGTISWLTISPAAITAQTNSQSYSPLFGGGSTGTGAIGVTAVTANGFYYELLYNTAAFTGSKIAAPTLTQLLSSWIDTGLEANNTTASTGKLNPLNPTAAAAVTGWAGGIGALGGTTNNIIIVGWSSNLGTSWVTVSNVLANWSTDKIANAFFGESSTGYLVPNQGNPGAIAFNAAANASGLPIFSLNTQLYALPIPEPATCALLGLGGLSLLLFRRRK
jgi:hypothetical protein